MCWLSSLWLKTRWWVEILSSCQKIEFEMLIRTFIELAIFYYWLSYWNISYLFSFQTRNSFNFFFFNLAIPSILIHSVIYIELFSSFNSCKYQTINIVYDQKNSVDFKYRSKTKQKIMNKNYQRIYRKFYWILIVSTYLFSKSILKFLNFFYINIFEKKRDFTRCKSVLSSQKNSWKWQHL